MAKDSFPKKSPKLEPEKITLKQARQEFDQRFIALVLELGFREAPSHYNLRFYASVNLDRLVLECFHSARLTSKAELAEVLKDLPIAIQARIVCSAYFGNSALAILEGARLFRPFNSQVNLNLAQENARIVQNYYKDRFETSFVRGAITYTAVALQGHETAVLDGRSFEVVPRMIELAEVFLQKVPLSLIKAAEPLAGVITIKSSEVNAVVLQNKNQAKDSDLSKAQSKQTVVTQGRCDAAYAALRQYYIQEVSQSAVQILLHSISSTSNFLELPDEELLKIQSQISEQHQVELDLKELSQVHQYLIGQRSYDQLSQQLLIISRKDSSPIERSVAGSPGLKIIEGGRSPEQTRRLLEREQLRTKIAEHKLAELRFLDPANKRLKTISDIVEEAHRAVVSEFRILAEHGKDALTPVGETERRSIDVHVILDRYFSRHLPNPDVRYKADIPLQAERGIIRVQGRTLREIAHEFYQARRV